MSILLRIPLLILVCFAASLTDGGSRTDHSTSGDDAVLREASLRLGHQTNLAVLDWLRQQTRVVSAVEGQDGQTVDLRFRDGQRAEILPDTLRKVGLPPSLLRTHTLLRTSQSTSPGRALVAEPFATELGLGSHAGDVEAADLRYAGFSVDQVYDGAVTVDFMKQLPQYSFVYMLTHSGVNQYGEGVIATGQPANDDAAMQPLMNSYSVLKVGVSGTSQLYYGVLSNYIKTYLGQFPAHAVLFLNGCSLLKASLIWQAFQSKGVDALLSWDEKGATTDDVTVGAYAMGELVQGQSVAGAVDATFRAGYGVSNADGIVAKFGYLGNGSLTWRDLLPPPTATPIPSPTATATPPAVTTPTALPLSLAVLSIVRPGALQTLRYQGPPHVRVRFRIEYPNGDRQTADRVTDSSGRATYTYIQPPSKLVHSGYDARVLVVNPLSRQQLATGSYRIMFGHVDVSVIPRRTTVRESVAIWVHTASFHRVAIVLHWPDGGAVRVPGRTGPHGWTHPRWRVPGNAGYGTGTATAQAEIGSHTYVARTSFTIR